MKNNLDRQYKELLEHIIHFGVDKKDRTGTGTKSIFGWQIRHRMSEGFPLLTTKKMAWKQIVTELLWFLRGDTNIKYLVDNDCHIWDGDCYANYLKQWGKVVPGDKTFKETWFKHNNYEASNFNKEEFINKIKTDDEFAKKWGELGPIYGRQWRDWNYIHSYGYEYGDQYPGTKSIDQIQNLINELKTNPDSRRLIVNAWNVGELDQMILPPCHYGFQVYTRELSREERWNWLVMESRKNKWTLPWDSMSIPQHKWFDQYNIVYNTNIPLSIPKRAISLMWNQRSADTFLGLPFNIASYGLLLCILGETFNMVPEDLIGNLGDCHLYNNHIEQAKEQMTRIPYELPKLSFDGEWLKIINENWYGNNFSRFIEQTKISDFQIENYQSHPAIKAPLSN